MHHVALGTAPPPSKVKIAKQAAADIEDELAAHREALNKLTTDLPLWAKEVSLAETEVESAVSALLSPIALGMIEHGERVARSLRPIRTALATL